MKYLVLYYSGAGNTEYISLRIARFLEHRGETVTIRRLTNQTIRDPDNDFDILGLGFPIYFRKSPDLVRAYLERLQGKKRSIFTYCTKGM